MPTTLVQFSPGKSDDIREPRTVLQRNPVHAPAPSPDVATCRGERLRASSDRIKDAVPDDLIRMLEPLDRRGG